MVYLPGLLLQALVDQQRRFLNNFGLSKYSLYAGIIGVTLHVVWCYVFVVHSDLEIQGLGLANVFTQFILFAGLLYFTNQEEAISKALTPPDRTIFQDLRPYLSLAVPSALMVILGWWIWELMVICGGLLGVPEQAATLVIMRVVMMAYMFSMGFDVAACSLIGQHIGNGSVAKAKQFFETI